MLKKWHVAADRQHTAHCVGGYREAVDGQALQDKQKLVRDTVTTAFQKHVLNI